MKADGWNHNRHYDGLVLAAVPVGYEREQSMQADRRQETPEQGKRAEHAHLHGARNGSARDQRNSHDADG